MLSPCALIQSRSRHPVCRGATGAARLPPAPASRPPVALAAHPVAASHAPGAPAPKAAAAAAHPAASLQPPQQQTRAPTQLARCDTCPYHQTATCLIAVSGNSSSGGLQKDPTRGSPVAAAAADGAAGVCGGAGQPCTESFRSALGMLNRFNHNATPGWRKARQCRWYRLCPLRDWHALL